MIWPVGCVVVGEGVLCGGRGGGGVSGWEVIELIVGSVSWLVVVGDCSVGELSNGSFEGVVLGSCVKGSVDDVIPPESFVVAPTDGFVFPGVVGLSDGGGSVSGVAVVETDSNDDDVHPVVCVWSIGHSWGVVGVSVRSVGFEVVDGEKVVGVDAVVGGWVCSV